MNPGRCRRIRRDAPEGRLPDSCLEFRSLLPEDTYLNPGKEKVFMRIFFMFVSIVLLPLLAWGGEPSATASIDFTGTIYGYLGVILFFMAYVLVPLENVIHLRKSKPVVLAAGVIWVLVAIAYRQIGDMHSAEEAIKGNLLEYAELFLFLLVAMTYINAMEERNVFNSLRASLVSRGFSLRNIFWVTGSLAFIISPVADNLTTALLMGAGGNGRRRQQQTIRSPRLPQCGDPGQCRMQGAPSRHSAKSPHSWYGKRARFIS